MKASSVSSTAQAPTPSPAPAQTLFLTEFSQVKSLHQTGNFDADQLQHRATVVTVTLKKIMETSCWDHGGINE